MKKDNYIVDVEVKNEFPPVYDNLCAAFEIKPNVYFTYGNAIYNPFNLPLPKEIVEHEKIHMKQQIDSPDLWWGKFLRDPEFRLSQEAPAYGRQYQVACERIKDRNQRFKYLRQLATSMSGPLYKNMVSHEEAMRLITLHS